MKRLLAGILIGFCLMAEPIPALRIAQPITFTEWDTNTFSQLNDVLLQMYNLTNGRYAFDIVTSDPDGSRRGDKGECVYFDTTTDQFCCNADSAVDWRCVNIT